MTFDFTSLPEHPYLVVLAVKDESRFHAIKEHLVEHAVGFVSFQESDLGDETTAIATVPVTEEKRGVFKKYQCLKQRVPAQLETVAA